MANANYHALQVNLRKRMQDGVQFDFNYTFSKSIDLASDAERIGFVGGLGGQIINSWDRRPCGQFPTSTRRISSMQTGLPSCRSARASQSDAIPIDLRTQL